MKRVWIPVLGLLLALTTGCNGSSSPTSPGGPGGGGGGGGVGNASAGTLTATVDGVSWTASLVTAARHAGAVAITGIEVEGFAVQIQFLEASPGTIVIGTLTPASGQVVEGEEFWSTITDGTGSIELTELSAGGARGTFSFTTGAHPTATPERRTISSGSFDVSFD